MPTSRTITNPSGGVGGLLRKLHSIKIGGPSQDPAKLKVGRKDLAFILSTLATLVENGLSLTRSLDTLARERALKKHTAMLTKLRQSIEVGHSFSKSLADYPATFTSLMVAQIQAGERSGTVGKTLRRIANNLESSNDLRSKIVKRLTYPAIVLAAGGGGVAFLLMVIVPVFQGIYENSNIPLPVPTQVLMLFGDVMSGYGWIGLIVGVGGFYGFRHLRRNTQYGPKIDAGMLRLPVLGEWFRDMAVLEFMEVMGTMLESGFKLVDALEVSGPAASNRAIRHGVDRLQHAIVRGEKLSRELERNAELFPPIVGQLVIVGEETGNLPESTRHVREHLQREIQRKTDLFVGAIEPVLTVGMALLIGGMLIAIYLPMFGMMDTLKPGP